MSIRNMMGLALLLGALAVPAQASLLGATVAAQFFFPTLDDPFPGAAFGPVVVGSGVEGPGPYVGNVISAVDVGADYITFGFTGVDAGFVWIDGVDFDGWRFDFSAGTFDDLASVGYAPNAYGYLDSMLTVTGDSLLVDWQGAFLLPAGESITLRFGFEPAAVPEPGTLALVGLGLIGLYAARKLRE